MNIRNSDVWRILAAGALIAAGSGFCASWVTQSRFESHIEYVEKQHDKRIDSIKRQHAKELREAKSASQSLGSIEKKIDLMKETMCKRGDR